MCFCRRQVIWIFHQNNCERTLTVGSWVVGCQEERGADDDEDRAIQYPVSRVSTKTETMPNDDDDYDDDQDGDDDKIMTIMVMTALASRMADHE